MERRNKMMLKMKEDTMMKSDLVPGLPIIEICDTNRVLIENHRGIIKYSSDEVCVKVRFGCACISGRQLELNRMSKNRLVITGRIFCIALHEREGNHAD